MATSNKQDTRLAAFNRFCELTTQEDIERMADEKNLHGHSKTFVEVRKLISDFSSVEDDEYKLSLFFVVADAIKWRDADMMRMAAMELYEPDSQADNPAWFAKIERSISGGRPALRLVK